MAVKVTFFDSYREMVFKALGDTIRGHMDNCSYSLTNGSKFTAVYKCDDKTVEVEYTVSIKDNT